MERIRDGRRGNLAAVNGLSRRRPRSGSLRDSPEEDGGAEMQETSRFRDRGGRKDRDRDRSTRSKRRRGDRLLHGSNREEGEDSTDESVDEEEEDDGEDSVPAVRLPPPPFSHPSPPPVTLPTNHNPRKIFPSNVMRPPAVWKAADEMIGVSVPRKARSAHAKRSHECLPSSSGGAGGGSGEQMHRQASTSPRSSQTSAAAAPPLTPISPASSSAPIRRKTKQITGGKQRPPKISKSSSSIQEIEIEVAEVLYGLTRQFQDSSKSEAQTLDSKEANGSCNETKSRASSPSCFSPPRAASQSSVLPHVPKRKRPRAVKYEDESPASHSNRPPAAANASVSSTSKASEAGQRPKMDIPSPKSEKTASSPAENGSVPPDSRSHPPEEPKPEEIAAAELETSVHSKEPARGFDGNDVAATTIKPVSEDDCDLSREKFQIDLMAPPPGKISPEMESDFVVEDSKPSAQDVERMTKAEFLKTEEPHERAVKPETRREDSSEKSEKISPHPDAPLDGERGDKVRIGGSKQPAQRPQQSKAMKPESRPDRAAGQSGPVPLPMSVAGWPGGLPFGYVGQVPSLPAIVPVDGSAAAAKALQQLRPRRCATHCYIAQNIYYQQLTRMNPFWPAKPYNLNMMLAADHAFPSRLQDSKAVPVAPLVGAIPVSKEKSSGLADTAQRMQQQQQQQQQLVLQQPLQPGAASNNILPAPAFIFPINQPQGAAASTPANRAAAAPSDSSAAPASAGAFNYGNLTPGEAQYLVLQNHGYPFPIPAHVGTTPYRGAAQALPFFNGSLYASQILHPSQLHQQQPPQGHQNASNSTGSSSSQKHSQKADPVEAPPLKHSQQRPPPHLLPHQARQMEGENGGGGDSPSSVDSRISHKGGGLYGHNFVMPLHPQNFALMALGGDKSQQQQQQQLHASSQQQGMKVELAPSQAFAMSFASFNGAVAAAAAGQAHALDFSSTAQNHAIFQSLPEAARHAYQAQHKKSQHHSLPDKSLTESMNSTGEDARKAMLAGKSSSRGNSIDGSSTRVMNTMNGSARTAPSRSDAGAPPASSSSSTPHQQRQQHLLHLQKQHQQHHHHHHQQQLQMQQHQQLASRAAKASGAGNSAAYPDRMPGGAAMSKLPNALSGVPQALMQGNNGPVGSPQWKNNANPRTSSAGALPSSPSPIPSNLPAATKNNHQGRTAPSPQSQQISFGIRPTGAAAAGAPAAPPVASPTSSVAKTMSGSPRASPTAAKLAAPPGSASQPAHQPKGPIPGSHGRSNGKSSSPSILGQPHLATSPGPGMKLPQQQSQKQQAFPPPQIFFANSYLQQQQQPPLHSLTLGGGAAATTSDPPSKTAPPPNSGMKGIPFISAAGFPYFHGMSSVPVKPAEQKPAAGS